MLFEHVLAYVAEWAYPILRKILESYAAVLGWVINITAYCAYIFVHDMFLLLFSILYLGCSSYSRKMCCYFSLIML